MWSVINNWKKTGDQVSGVLYNAAGEPSKSRNEYFDNWAEFYQNLYTPKATPPQARRAKIKNRVRASKDFRNDELNAPITKAEFGEALKRQRADAAPGDDEISSKILKMAPPWLTDHIHNLLSACWETEHPMDAFKTLIIAPLLKDKKKDHADPSNYRPIALITSILKLYESIIQHRITNFAEGFLDPATEAIFTDHITGFRPGRSTLDNILTLKETIINHRDEKRGKGRQLWLAFLDIRKAFDKVNREILWDALWEAGIRGKMWRIVKGLFSDFLGKVRVRGEFSRPFKILQGVIQGSRLGPLLFNIFFKSLIDKVKDMRGAVLSHGLKLSILCYADDCILIANSKKDLQLLINACYSHSLDHGYSFAPEKCKVMKLHVPKNTDSKIYMGAHTLEVVDSYKYLGIVFESAHQNYKIYLDSIIQKIATRSMQLRAIGLDKDGLRATTAIKIYKTLVRPLIDYAAQVLHFNKQTMAALEKEQIQFIKRALGLEIYTSSGAALIVSGIIKIEARVAQLKLKYWNRIKAKPNEIIQSILEHPGPKRGFVQEITQIEQEWSTGDLELTCDKLDKIESKSYQDDMALLRRNPTARFALCAQYSQSDNAAPRYAQNNILKTLDRVDRKHRSKFLQLLLGQDPLSRFEKCEKCGFVYNHEIASEAPLVHLLIKCPHFQSQRKVLFDKVEKALNFSFRALGLFFRKSTGRKGTDAAAILMGCNAATYNIKGEIVSIYRKLKKPRAGEKHIDQQILDIPTKTAKFIGHIFEEHGLE